LLGWELFITNVSKEVLTSKDIAEFYFIRWRLEIIFKSWKSYFKIINIPKDANKIRTESYIYCMLIFIVLFQVHFYNRFISMTKTKAHRLNTREISLLRLMQFITRNIEFVLLCGSREGFSNEDFLFNQMNYYCTYETRSDRVNFYQKILKLS